MNPIFMILFGGGALAYLAYLRSQAATQPTLDPNAPNFVQQALQQVRQFFMGTQLAPSESILQYIQNKETFRPNPYPDPPGQTATYSIGYGHKIVPGDPYWPYGSLTSISQDQASGQFDADVGAAAAVVQRLVTVPLTQGQFDALTDFVYNVGQGNFASSTLLAKLNTSDYAGAANEFNRWIYANGQVNGGLVARRQDETNLFNLA